MKYATKHDRQFLLRKALFLRYGFEITIDQKKEELGQPILPVAIVAKLLKVPEQQLRDLIKQHFKNVEKQNRVSLQPPKLNP